MSGFGDQEFPDTVIDFEREYNDTLDPTLYIDYTTQYTKTLDSIEPQEQEIIAEEAITPANPSKKKKKKSKLSSETEALSMFFIGQRHPKKEYVRCKLIRGHKRALRQVYTKKYPSATIHKIDIQVEAELLSWKAFTIHASKFKDYLTEVCKTENGPMTDGVAKRTQQKKMSAEIQKSFNDNFCREYFLDPIRYESYKLYIGIIFATFDAENLCSRFEFTCCSEDNTSHYPDCLRKWKSLEKFIKDGMVQELEVHLPKEATEVAETEEVDLLDF